ncbi:MAG: Asp-tRNA(Asn)/Glu-tRNA(Gln) amidotransferase subunit GatC [Proteobacteria bacterium]|nr:Asp-tRNA(Asn)/Glu-tRNA(Gln) amidotransferase subunit GatC [Pseudomonadota bacterium]
MAESLTQKDVEEIARLARLELSPDEVESLRTELTAILEHMAVLQALDTEGVEPMTHAVPMHLRLRPDNVGPSLSVDQALGDAPDRADEYFQVPNIIKTNVGE